MPDESLDLLEERIIVLRDKAAREGINIPDEVVSYIAEKYRLPQALKGALINVSAYAARRQIPVTIDIARLVLDGIRPGTAVQQGVTTNFPVASVTEKLSQEAELESESLEAGESEDTVDLEITQEVEIRDDSRMSPYEVSGSNPVAESNICQLQEHPVVLTEDDVMQATLFDEMQVFIESDEQKPKDSSESHIEVETPQDFESMPHVPELEAEEEPKKNDFTEESAHESVLGAVPQRVREIAGQPRKSRVFFVPMRTRRKRSLIERIGMALMRAGLDEVIEGGDKVAVKVHFGEKGNTGFVSPIYVREVVRLIKELGGKPFLTDANTLYTGQRSNAIDHLECALANGFSYATVQAPVIIADGLLGHEGVDVPINGKNCETVRIGAAAAEADALVVISHVKGHGEAGFGGAIKNVGMGLGTRSAKQRMHSDVKPEVYSPNCTKCGRCVAWCPVQCIGIGPQPEDKALIDSEHCIGCGECVAACAYDAIKISWDADPTSFQEKIVEHVQGVLNTKGDKVIYLNFLTNISPECDCWKFTDAAIVPDIGILASRDIVSIEQASLDLVKKAVGSDGSVGEGMPAGTDKFLEIHKVDATIGIKYAEEVGLGTREYLVTEIG